VEKSELDIIWEKILQSLYMKIKVLLWRIFLRAINADIKERKRTHYVTTTTHQTTITDNSNHRKNDIIASAALLDL